MNCVDLPFRTRHMRCKKTGGESWFCNFVKQGPSDSWFRSLRKQKFRWSLGFLSSFLAFWAGGWVASNPQSHWGWEGRRVSRSVQIKNHSTTRVHDLSSSSYQTCWDTQKCSIWHELRIKDGQSFQFLHKFVSFSLREPQFLGRNPLYFNAGF